MRRTVAFSGALVLAIVLTNAAFSKPKRVSPERTQKRINSISPVSPWPSKTGWVRYDTLSAPTPGQLVGRFATTYEEACDGKTPFTSFPREGWKSPIQGRECKDGWIALNPELAN